MFGYRVGFSGTADPMVQLSNLKKSKMVADGHLGYTKVAITLQPVCCTVAHLPLLQLGFLVGSV